MLLNQDRNNYIFRICTYVSKGVQGPWWPWHWCRDQRTTCGSWFPNFPFMRLLETKLNLQADMASIFTYRFILLATWQLCKQNSFMAGRGFIAHTLFSSLEWISFFFFNKVILHLVDIKSTLITLQAEQFPCLLMSIFQNASQDHLCPSKIPSRKQSTSLRTK